MQRAGRFGSRPEREACVEKFTITLGNALEANAAVASPIGRCCSLSREESRNGFMAPGSENDKIYFQTHMRAANDPILLAPHIYYKFYSA